MGPLLARYPSRVPLCKRTTYTVQRKPARALCARWEKERGTRNLYMCVQRSRDAAEGLFWKGISKCALEWVLEILTPCFWANKYHTQTHLHHIYSKEVKVMLKASSGYIHKWERGPRVRWAPAQDNTHKSKTRIHVPEDDSRIQVCLADPIRHCSFLMISPEQM